MGRTEQEFYFIRFSEDKMSSKYSFDKFPEGDSEVRIPVQVIYLFIF